MENMIFDAEIVCYKLNMPVNTEKKSETILLNYLLLYGVGDE